jgi:hypothetical protein
MGITFLNLFFGFQSDGFLKEALDGILSSVGLIESWLIYKLRMCWGRVEALVRDHVTKHPLQHHPLETCHD